MLPDFRCAPVLPGAAVGNTLLRGDRVCLASRWSGSRCSFRSSCRSGADDRSGLLAGGRLAQFVSACKGDAEQRRHDKENPQQLFIPQEDFPFSLFALQHFYFELY